MGTTLVYLFVGFFALAIGQSIVRRVKNPYEEVGFEILPTELRFEIERVLPGFRPERVRLTRNRDEARVQGDYLGEKMSVEANFDAEERLVEFEAETFGARRLTDRIDQKQVSPMAHEEITRVLGAASESFTPASCAEGTLGDESLFEVRGRADGWKWEIAVTESGRLLEVEKEMPGRH